MGPVQKSHEAITVLREVSAPNTNQTNQPNQHPQLKTQESISQGLYVCVLCGENVAGLLVFMSFLH